MRTVLLLAGLALFASGCVVTTSEREGLPTGVTLLDSDHAYCDGPIEIKGDPDVVVDEGESTTVAVNDDDNAEWECMSGSSRDEHDFDCPAGTSYLRVSRDEDEAEFTVECFGG